MNNNSIAISIIFRKKDFSTLTTMWALRHRKREWNTNHFVVCTDGDNFVYFESIVGDSGGVKVDIIILKG